MGKCMQNEFWSSFMKQYEVKINFIVNIIKLKQNKDATRCFFHFSFDLDLLFSFAYLLTDTCIFLYCIRISKTMKGR